MKNIKKDPFLLKEKIIFALGEENYAEVNLLSLIFLKLEIFPEVSKKELLQCFSWFRTTIYNNSFITDKFLIPLPASTSSWFNFILLEESNNVTTYLGSDIKFIQETVYKYYPKNLKIKTTKAKNSYYIEFNTFKDEYVISFRAENLWDRQLNFNKDRTWEIRCRYNAILVHSIGVDMEEEVKARYSKYRVEQQRIAKDAFKNLNDQDKITLLQELKDGFI